jgi:hypothetical protein
MKKKIITASLFALASSAMAGQHPGPNPTPSLSPDQAQVLKYAGAPFAQNPRSLERAIQMDSDVPCSMVQEYLGDPGGQQLLFSAMAENQLSPKQGQKLIMDYQNAMCGGRQF